MAATIYIDVGDLPGRLSELRPVMQPGDRILVTKDGHAIFHLLPTTREGATLTHIGVALPPPGDLPPARRKLGEGLGKLSIPDNFNDPSAWIDSIADVKPCPCGGYLPVPVTPKG